LRLNIVYFDRTRSSKKFKLIFFSFALWSIGNASSNTFSTDSWYHISFVKNSGIINSYVNGVLQTRSTEAGGASGNALVGGIIGARYDDSYITFVAAKMDEINISNYAKYLENFVPNARGAF